MEVSYIMQNVLNDRIFAPKPCSAVLLVAFTLFAAQDARGDNAAPINDLLLATPAKADFRIYPEDIAVNEAGEVQKSADGAASAVQLAVGLGKTYEVPWCIEYPVNGQEVRVPIKPGFAGFHGRARGAPANSRYGRRRSGGIDRKSVV